MSANRYRMPNRRLIPIVILNWNGEEDTMDCLRSLRRGERAGFVPVLVDNGSAPESVDRLERECRVLFPKVLALDPREISRPAGSGEDRLAGAVDEDTLVFIRNEENLGFAKGSNVGVRLADRLGADWVMLLNNDTVVAPDALRELRTFLEARHEFVALTAQIRHHSPSSRVQNCGGMLTFLGSRRYAFANADASALPSTSYSVVTFATGCALMFKHRITGPLTEDFFFGEEDYEFSLRLKKRGLQMACVHRAVVHHKGGATIGRASRAAGSVLVHYANRLVNVRNHYSWVRWQATRAFAYVYLPVLLLRRGINPWKAIGMIRTIESHLKRHRGVGRADFHAMIGRG